MSWGWPPAPPVSGRPEAGTPPAGWWGAVSLRWGGEAGMDSWSLASGQACLCSCPSPPLPCPLFWERHYGRSDAASAAELSTWPRAPSPRLATRRAAQRSSRSPSNAKLWRERIGSRHPSLGESRKTSVPTSSLLDMRKKHPVRREGCCFRHHHGEIAAGDSKALVLQAFAKAS